MYIPLCLFYDGTTSKGQMAETDIHPDGIHITYSTEGGEKKEINFNFSSIIRVIRRPNEKLLIVFGTSPQQMVEVRALPQVVAFLKTTDLLLGVGWANRFCSQSQPNAR